MENMMDAIVKPTPAEGLILTRVPVPEPKAGEVQIKIHKTAICGSDVHIYKWNQWAQQHAGFQTFGYILRIGICRDRENWYPPGIIPAESANGARGTAAIQHRHPQIEQNIVVPARRAFLECLHAGSSVFRFGDLSAVPCENRADDLPVERVVLADQNAAPVQKHRSAGSPRFRFTAGQFLQTKAHGKNRAASRFALHLNRTAHVVSWESKILKIILKITQKQQIC